MAYAWMPEAVHIRAETDGGTMIGGAPRAVWLTLGTAADAVSVQSAAQVLVSEQRPCHLVWDPGTGDVAQLIPALRAGRALGAAGHRDWAPGRAPAPRDNVNAHGRVCVQIAVLGHPREPFTGGALRGVESIMSWLDSWGVPRRWPAGRPQGYRGDAHWDAHGDLPARLAGVGGRCSRAQWARGGHFGASQVPGCDNAGPGAIDIDQITGPHGRRALPAPRPDAALLIPA